MILELVENGPLIWPMIEENGMTRTKKNAELFAAERIQVDCDMKAPNIILQGLPADIYSLVNHHRVSKDLLKRVQLLMQEQFQVNTKFLNSLPPERSKFVNDVQLVKDLHTTNFDQLHEYLEQHELHANEVRLAVLVFSLGDDLIACLNKAVAFLITVASSRQCTQPMRPRNAAWYKDKATIVEAHEAGHILDEKQFTEDLDTYDSGCDDISNAKAVLMANISNYGSNVISEVPHYETCLNDMENQSVHTMQDFKHTPVVDVTDNEITSDSNIILFSQYLQETQQANVQDTNLQAQQD
uniref:Integrase, catalytic region, zinc finger, CCHC-type, peptidase aspartic, catalytic n=1 Tax=Tanacetum cinerariifolium TaxID=118510 RepID=A0A699K982_TANCI|nr:hypothetical protein [Tanacetum cinerariifolium]